MRQNSTEGKIWIAGPCAAESEEQVLETARRLFEKAKQSSIELFAYRAGAWKVRSAPGGFEGAGERALSWLKEVQDSFKTPVCVEVVNPGQVEKCADHGIRMFWIGARTSVNPAEVQSIADVVRNTDFTVMVKNPIIPDLKLWIGNIERFIKAGVKSVMAVHRGFSDVSENVLRNAPLWEIPIDLKVRMPELPILCDPSHICGRRDWIAQIAQTALNYGFNGLMVEAHCCPENALSDSLQQLKPEQWASLVSGLSLRSETPNIELEKLRSKLQNIDSQISELLYQRMSVVDEIAMVKRENNISVVQPLQWEHVVQRYRKHTDDACYQRFIDEFLEILHQNSIKRQR
ncbi:MAG: chorismate mutase [Bacteroidales bacterium]|nr:chorismate mutase [Bacteroidales bacterium]